MADSVWAPGLAAAQVQRTVAQPRHSLTVRVTHWITVLCFFALLLSGVEVLISHPRFYWGEAGNAAMQPLFALPIPASRATVPTGYGYVLPDQNGWSRSLHFQAAWALVITGAWYVLWGVFSRHYRKQNAYNPLQRLTYLGVVFGLFPLMIWTGLAMSPAIASAYPFVVTILGGQQSARTLHFFATVVLVLFLFVHVVMVYRAGFRKLMRDMLTGNQEAL